MKSHQESFTNNEILEIIKVTCPELTISQVQIDGTTDYQWFWDYGDLIRSPDIGVEIGEKNPEGYFNSPVEALANFAQFLADLQLKL